MEIKNKFDNIISLGFFCGVSLDLQKMGLRSASYPFDWLLSSFSSVVNAIDSKFDRFLVYDNLSQNVFNRSHYRDDLYGFEFFHDFNYYQPLRKQYDKIQKKYLRRIARFYSSIQKPTLFIRYISSETNSDGKLTEIEYICPYT